MAPAAFEEALGLVADGSDELGVGGFWVLSASVSAMATPPARGSKTANNHANCAKDFIFAS